MTSPDSALLADIGATNARFALLVGSEIKMPQTYALADYASPVDAARSFLAGPALGHLPSRALIAAAGPIVNGRISLTNASWTVDPARIGRGLNMTDVRVLNDFEALGWSLPALRSADIVSLGVCEAADR